MMKRKGDTDVMKHMIKAKERRRVTAGADDDANLVPKTDVFVSDVGIVRNAMSFGAINFTAWLKSKTLAEIQAMDEISTDESKTVAGRMNSYSHFVVEMARLSELEEAIGLAKRALCEKFVESYTTQYRNAKGIVSHKQFRIDLTTRETVLKEMAAMMQLVPVAPVPTDDADMDL